MIYIFYVMCTATIIALLMLKNSATPKDKYQNYVDTVLEEHKKVCLTVLTISKEQRPKYIELIKHVEKGMKIRFNQLEKSGVKIPKWKSIEDYV